MRRGRQSAGVGSALHNLIIFTKDGQTGFVQAGNDWALRFAALNGHLPVTQLLLDRGADVHAAENAALRNAAEKRHPSVVTTLLRHGANLCALSLSNRAFAIRAARDDEVAALRTIPRLSPPLRNAFARVYDAVV